MSPAFSHCFLKRFSAFSKDSSGSTMTLVTHVPPLRDLYGQRMAKRQLYSMAPPEPQSGAPGDSGPVAAAALQERERLLGGLRARLLHRHRLLGIKRGQD